jgi:hypothetical protein
MGGSVYHCRMVSCEQSFLCPSPVAYTFKSIDHFQSVARSHFTGRRLEQKYGKNIVFPAYEQLRQDLKIIEMIPINRR